MLILGLGWSGLAIAAAAFFLAGFARGYAGFGLSAIIVAALTLLLPPAEVVPIAILLEVTASVRAERRASGERSTGGPWSCCWSAPPPAIRSGVAGLVWLSADTARIIIASTIVVASLLMLGGIRVRRASGTLGSIGAGFVSGVANGAVGAGRAADRAAGWWPGTTRRR